MSEMAAAFTASDLDTPHSMGEVVGKGHSARLGIVKARPTASGVKFCFRRKKLLTAGGARISAVSFFVPILTGKWPLRSL